MDRQANNQLKILEDKLYLLDSSLLITPKRKGQPTIPYGTEILHSPTLEMQYLNNSLEFPGPPVERTEVTNYVKDAKFSTGKVKDDIKPQTKLNKTKKSPNKQKTRKTK